MEHGGQMANWRTGWSLWSKDIIFLITSDSKAGPQAWVEAYHDGHSPPEVASLPLKSGALEGAIVVDNPLDHRFENIHISYDGINGQLPNLDLFNTAVSIANGQHGIGASLQRMWTHNDSYKERLQTIFRGMTNQGLGHASGPHSSFIPYHVDAITIRAVGNGWQDDMALGRVVESLFRSLNNLMEHFHQSFFLYLLMQTNRFVSIGTYLPSAMLVAASFTIMAMALWVASGRPPKSNIATPFIDKKSKRVEVEVIEKDGMTSVVPRSEITVVERHLLLPAALILSFHFLGAVPLYIFNHTAQPVSLDPGTFRDYTNKPQSLISALYAFTVANFVIPTAFKTILTRYASLTRQHYLLIKCFSLLLLGMFLATLATVNFSLSFFIGLLSAHLSVVGPLPGPSQQSRTFGRAGQIGSNIIIHVLSPPVVFMAACYLTGVDAQDVLMEAAFGWKVWGLWTQVIVWCVWWPAWLAAAVVESPGI